MGALICCTLFSMNEQRQKQEPTIEEIYRLAKDTNRMLHAMRRDAFVGGIVKFIFWIALFVVVPYVLYVIYLQPYLAEIQSAYENINSNVNTLSGAAKDLEDLRGRIPNFGDALKRFQGTGE